MVDKLRGVHLCPNGTDDDQTQQCGQLLHCVAMSQSVMTTLLMMTVTHTSVEARKTCVNHCLYLLSYSRAQSTVDFPTGGHVNVLSDYMETGPDNFFLF